MGAGSLLLMNSNTEARGRCAAPSSCLLYRLSRPPGTWRLSALVDTAEPVLCHLSSTSVVNWLNHSASGAVVGKAVREPFHLPPRSTLSWLTTSVGAAGMGVPGPFRLLPTSCWKCRRIAGPPSGDVLRLMTAPPERLMQVQQGPNC